MYIVHVHTPLESCVLYSNDERISTRVHTSICTLNKFLFFSFLLSLGNYAGLLIGHGALCLFEHWILTYFSSKKCAECIQLFLLKYRTRLCTGESTITEERTNETKLENARKKTQQIPFICVDSMTIHRFQLHNTIKSTATGREKKKVKPE